MAKFRANPVVIEATQFWKKGDHPAVKEVGVGAYNENGDILLVHRTKAYISTLEGDMQVTPGDWIITGTKGEHYPVKDDIFREKYTAVEDGEGKARFTAAASPWMSERT